MFEVTSYEHPRIFVSNRQNAETHILYVEDDGTLVPSGTQFDQGEARRAAIRYLYRLRMTKGPDQTRLSA